MSASSESITSSVPDLHNRNISPPWTTMDLQVSSASQARFAWAKPSRPKYIAELFTMLSVVHTLFAIFLKQTSRVSVEVTGDGRTVEPCSSPAWWGPLGSTGERLSLTLTNLGLDTTMPKVVGVFETTETVALMASPEYWFARAGIGVMRRPE